MDKKNQSESDKKAEHAVSPDDDSALAGDASVNKESTLESVPSESESIDSEIAAPIETEIDKDEPARKTDEAALIKDSDDPGNVKLPDETTGEAELESAQAETDGEGVTGKDAQSSIEDKEVNAEDRETEGEEIEEPDEGDFSDAGETEEIGESEEEAPAFEEMDQTGKTEDDGEGDVPLTQNQTESETAGTGDDTDDPAQELTVETPEKKKSALKVAVSAAIIAAVFSGFFFFDNKSKLETTPQKAAKFSQSREVGSNNISGKKRIRPLPPGISSAYNAKIEAVSALRGSLLLKQQEIIRLKKHYRDGIEELEKEIWDESQKRQCRTFFEAMENDSIAFTLRTIQRKQAYIQQLERPLKWIHQACEELLYIKRSTLVDLDVAEIVAGIDMNRHVRRIDAAVRKYQPDADKLAPEMTNPQLEPLEAIWDRIQEKTQQYASARLHSKNWIISEQICAGDFRRLTELSEISSQTARCITEVRASDLFLNNVSEISPGAARQLIYWKGSWICLNGIRALSPRTAHYLFQWDGNWISLNGLTEFPAEIGEALLQWEGRQLELMGLRYTEELPSKIAFEYLARWERAGGKLFVPESVRKKINEIHRKSI